MHISGRNIRALSFPYPEIYARSLSISICFLSTSTLSLCSSQFLKSKLKWRKHSNGLFQWLQVLQSMVNRSANWVFLIFLLYLCWHMKTSNIFCLNLYWLLKWIFTIFLFFFSPGTSKQSASRFWVGWRVGKHRVSHLPLIVLVVFVIIISVNNLFSFF